MNIIELAKEAGFEVVDGELRLYFDGSNALLKPNLMGTVVDGLKEFAAIVRAEPKWVDLTCEEVTALIREGAADGGWQGFAAQVQHAFKEKQK